jgi:AraC family transcriptional regulator, regulatory protein of adaptative response / methylated-DNA-[protein]-cysteine methyltransferase
MAAVKKYETPAQRWKAIITRDHAADGAFVLAVTSTGIFCRPICPAKRPRRDRVVFYDTPAQARKAGYRACLRCKPEDEAYGRRHATAIARATSLIRASEAMPSLSQLAKTAGMSVYHFHRLFRRTIGVTPRQFRTQLMIDRAKSSLRDGGSVTAALYDAGFSSNGRFYEATAGRMGMTPRQVAAGGESEAIRFVLRRCELGVVLVAATEKGICEVWLGDNAATLTKRLEAAYPQAKLTAHDPKMSDLIGKVVELVVRPTMKIALPLDLNGTAFEMRVWETLRRIPVGQTMTYGQIAEAIGHPGAARAVGRACAQNHAAVVVPCHRAIGADKSLRGYRWGLARKRRLLEREAAVAVKQ